MTDLAIIIAMIPMALGRGEGGEQNAPIGRAVIGGLLFATVGTLFIVPVMYSMFSKEPPVNWDKRIDALASTSLLRFWWGSHPTTRATASYRRCDPDLQVLKGRVHRQHLTAQNNLYPRRQVL